MARKKTIKREHILSAAYEVVSTEGFSGFTARNIASKMKTSTQPIYLEFKNMDELREKFIEELFFYLQEEIYDKEITGDSLVDMAICYIEFAKKEETLFRSVFIDPHQDSKRFTKFSHDLFMERIAKDQTYDEFDEDKKESIFLCNLLVITGIASLSSAKRVCPSQEEIVSIIKSVTDHAINAENLTISN